MISQPGSLVRVLSIVALTAAGAAACSSNKPIEEPAKPRKSVSAPKPGYTPAPRPATVGERAASVALQQLGVPYLYGGTTPRGFDCSGLVHYAYASAGKLIPRTTGALWSALPAVENRRLRIGDLLFFRIAGKMSHVGIYLGNRRFVHAPSSGRAVTVESLDSDFYRDAFIRAGRP